MDEDDCREFVNIMLAQCAAESTFSIYLPDPAVAKSIIAEFERRGMSVKYDVASACVTVSSTLR